MVVTGVTAMQPLMSSGHLAACREPWVEVKLGTPPHTCPAHPRILQQPKLNHCTPKPDVVSAQLARGGKCAEPTCSTGVQWLRLGHCKTLGVSQTLNLTEGPNELAGLDGRFHS